MNTPQTFTPLSPDQFIGPAQRLAVGLSRKAESMIATGDPAKLLITGCPGCGKTAIANMIAGMLAKHPTSIEAVNGRNVTADKIRYWQDSSAYRAITGGFMVKIVNELDLATATAQDLLLSWLDDLPKYWAIIGTSNQRLADLSERFQSRFQQFKLYPPSETEIATFLETFGLNGHSTAIAKACKGNVRAALLDAQSVLDLAA